MLSFTNKDYPNFHMKVIGSKLQIATTLNVTPQMLEHLDPKCVVKVSKFHVYYLRALVELKDMNEERILSVANNLIDRCMLHCREAKKKVLDQEIANIRLHQPRILSQS